MRIIINSCEYSFPVDFNFGSKKQIRRATIIWRFQLRSREERFEYLRM